MGVGARRTIFKGDLDLRIELKFEKKKASFVEEIDISKKLAAVTTGILRGVFGRESTQDEILGDVDITKASVNRKKRKND